MGEKAIQNNTKLKWEILTLTHKETHSHEGDADINSDIVKENTLTETIKVKQDVHRDWRGRENTDQHQEERCNGKKCSFHLVIHLDVNV